MNSLESKLKHLKTNSFDYSKLKKISDLRFDSFTGKETQNNLMTITSAISKEEIDSKSLQKMNENEIPKCIQDFITLRKILPDVVDINSIAETLSKSDPKRHFETDRISGISFNH